MLLRTWLGSRGRGFLTGVAGVTTRTAGVEGFGGCAFSGSSSCIGTTSFFGGFGELVFGVDEDMPPAAAAAAASFAFFVPFVYNFF